MHSSSSGVFSNCRVATSVLFKPGLQSQMAVLLGSHYMSEIFPFLPPICQFYLLFSHSVISDALLQSSWLLCPWDFPGKNTRVGCHFLLQGIFPTQGLNPHLLLGRWVFFFFFFLTTEPPGKPCQNALISTRTQDLSVLSINTLYLHSVIIRVYVAPW